ncbi:MAG: von Willebrand factor type A domain-containing protein [Candidatus Eremiobacteraeota bacterium]|nr:von Willebrand factor type A domain-containing protein [Candidatus Eremiobacteraeota bacterium]
MSSKSFVKTITAFLIMLFIFSVMIGCSQTRSVKQTEETVGDSKPDVSSGSYVKDEVKNEKMDGSLSGESDKKSRVAGKEGKGGRGIIAREEKISAESGMKPEAAPPPAEAPARMDYAKRKVIVSKKGGKLKRPAPVTKGPDPRSAPPVGSVGQPKKIKSGHVSIAEYTPKDKPMTPPEEMKGDVFFKKYGTNPFVDTEDDHLSTFSIDVDTASYTIARKYLNRGIQPSDASVRVEEFVNYFKYGYAPPQRGTFAMHMEAAPAKFAKNCNLLRVGIKGKEIKKRDRKRANLTFVIDTSGSMNRGNRIGVVKNALEILVNELRQGDRIGIVTYSRTAKVLMEHRGVENKQQIIAAIKQLRPRGSTNIEKGLLTGYELANKYYQDKANNRVILLSDGVGNVGKTKAKEMLKTVEEYKDDGIYLTTVGVGLRNYNDATLEGLADKGNGQYAYVDSLDEAKRIFVQNLTGTLQVIAKDTKIQVDFNPKVVRSYRLMGYENRDIADKDFRNDTKDAGEVGAGHSVTALYEFKLWPQKKGKIATVFVRYKDPKSGKVSEIKRVFKTDQVKKSFKSASDSFKLAASVAEFAEILRKSYWAKDAGLGDVMRVLKSLGANYKQNPDVKELIELVATTGRLRKIKGKR